VPEKVIRERAWAVFSRRGGVWIGRAFSAEELADEEATKANTIWAQNKYEVRPVIVEWEAKEKK
jgi:hypothetical protein